MTLYKREKILNAISFFADQHRKKARKPLYQTFLYKYLAFLDFYSLREVGSPCLGLIYKAMKKGPVPIEIYNDKSETEKYIFVKNQWGEVVISKGEPNLNYFYSYEVELMNRLIEIYAKRWVTTSVMIDSSHEDILAWKRTWAKNPNDIIDYALEFNGDLFSKKDDQLTYPERVFLTYKAISS